MLPVCRPRLERRRRARSSPTRRLGASTSPARPARTTSRSTRRTPSPSGCRRSARRRSANARRSRRCGAPRPPRRHRSDRLGPLAEPARAETGRRRLHRLGGIAGAQTILRVLLTERAAAWARRCRTSPASRAWRLHAASASTERAHSSPAPTRTSTIVDLEGRVTLAQGQLDSRHRLSRFLGRALKGGVVRTIVRGSTVRLDGGMVALPRGWLVRPAAGVSTEAELKDDSAAPGGGGAKGATWRGSAFEADGAGGQRGLVVLLGSSVAVCSYLWAGLRRNPRW